MSKLIYLKIIVGTYDSKSNHILQNRVLIAVAIRLVNIEKINQYKRKYLKVPNSKNST